MISSEQFREMEARCKANVLRGLAADVVKLHTPDAPKTIPEEAVFEIMPSNDEAKLNKTERERLAWLRTLGVQAIGVQAITLKLGNDCRFTPDFNYITGFGRMVFEDVKGFQRDDALVKIKAAARKFSWATFLIVKKGKPGWEETEIKP